jgi:hypothetical protein
LIGQSGNSGWRPYYNYVDTEVHYPGDYNAGDPGNHFVFSNILVDGGHPLQAIYYEVGTESNGQYQNVYYPLNNTLQVWGSRNWGANP